jgi:cytochrome c biogenesis protein
MRTALVLLFVIAAASILGSVFPQRPVSPERVQQYIADNPGVGPVLDKIGLFDVFGSAWFTAIYVALLAALVACLFPRGRALARLVRAEPPRSGRLAAYRNRAGIDLPATTPARAAAAVGRILRGRRWRVAEHDLPEPAVELAAEKGYLREAGSILFHASFLLLLIGLVVGKGFGFRGQATIVEGAGWANTRINYDAFQPGRFFRPSDLPGFSLHLDDFSNAFHPNGVPADYGSTFTATGADGTVQRQRVSVNHPLTVDGVRIFQADYGYAPHLRIADAAGKAVLDGPVEMLRDPATEISTRGLRLPSLKGELGQVGLQLTFFTGLEPGDGQTPFRNRPEVTNPVLVVLPLQGDLRAGQPGSVYTLDTSRLEPMGDRPLVLRPGQRGTLPNGATVGFPELRQYTVVTLASDPGVPIVGAAAVLLLASLLPSLYVRRRRVWARVEPSGEGSRVELAGLAFQGKDAFVEEFQELRERIRRELGPDPGPPPDGPPDTSRTTLAPEQPGALTRGD